MRKNFKIRFLLWGLIMILGTIGIVGCSSDDGEDIYQGFIQHVETEAGLFHIKVTKSPSNVGTNMPRTRDELSVSLADFPNMNFKEQQKLTFSIISAEGGFNLAIYDWSVWRCKIKILKIE